MNCQLTIILIITCSLFSFSQQERTIKRGQILEFQNPIYGVHIYNLNTLQGISTSDQGKFEVYIKLNDTLIITHIKYQPLLIIVTEKHIENEPFIIYMHEFTNYLDTITLKNHDLMGSLTFDIQKEIFIKIDQKYKLIEEYIKLAKMPTHKDYERNMEKPPSNNVDPTGGPSVGGSVGIPFKFKDLILRRKLRSKRNTPKRIITDFGLDYFINTLKIPEEKIHHFLTYCNYKNIFDLYKKNEIIKVLDILQEESVEYLKIED